MKIISVIGARPQFIKAAVVSRALRALPEIREDLLHTGQHYDEAMAGRFFRELEIPRPRWNLGVGSGSHAEQTAGMMRGLEDIFLESNPDWVLVYGDTNSTLAAALVASKLQLPIAHVEAGLRSFNRQMPEEINRILTDRVSSLLFTPTALAEQNLRREGIAESQIHTVGDVMYDAALWYAEKAREESTILEDLGLQPKGYMLVTVHRAENTNRREHLEAILDGLAELNGHWPLLAPLHPRTQAALQREGLSDRAENILQIIPPVGYLDMIRLQRDARVILTDSGGIQKEAFFQQTPCITLRKETEWVELVDLGWNHLCPPGEASLRKAMDCALSGPGKPAQPYGDGHAARRIAECLQMD